MGCDLSYALKSWLPLLSFPKLMFIVCASKPTVTHRGLVRVLEADLGTPSICVFPSAFIFGWFYKKYTASANSAFQAKSSVPSPASWRVAGQHSSCIGLF